MMTARDLADLLGCPVSDEPVLIVAPPGGVIYNEDGSIRSVTYFPDADDMPTGMTDGQKAAAYSAAAADARRQGRRRAATTFGRKASRIAGRLEKRTPPRKRQTRTRPRQYRSRATRRVNCTRGSPDDGQPSEPPRAARYTFAVLPRGLRS